MLTKYGGMLYRDFFYRETEKLHNLVHLYAMLHTQEDNLNSGEHDLLFAL